MFSARRCAVTMISPESLEDAGVSAGSLESPLSAVTSPAFASEAQINAARQNEPIAVLVRYVDP
jgi:hypothetical protein